MKMVREEHSHCESDVKLKFAPNNSFQIELRRRVDDYLHTHGLRARDCFAMYLKSTLILTCFVAVYVLLVFVAKTGWQAVPLAVLLGFLASGIGLNIQHDGGHKAYSKHGWINALAAMTLDMIGGSSYCWRWKHAVFHHTYVNIAGHDTDIDFGAMARLSPYQKRLPFHRWQQFYLWPLYGFMVLRWHLFGDYRDLVAGTIGAGGPRFVRPKGWDLAVFIAGKVFFITIAFVIPILFHPVWKVAVCYAIAASVMGVTMSIVFQLAHCVEEAVFVPPPGESGRIENAWAIHQAETTVDFARGSRVASWLLGGLNFQIEHHLLPQICNVNYPAITKLVENTCQEYGVKYAEHKTIWAGLVSHYRWLRAMGNPDPASRAQATQECK
ncbi:MAG TPA: acyl-CoA desaturase [Planctomycetota bacterium]|nr:acyl-CoA desaturase [Planctomycetota bacterium]